MRSAAPRLAFIDALKAVASQLIVLHHLAFYGPMSEVASGLLPGLFAWLYQDARIAVQVFLVVGGYLAARALAPGGELTSRAPLALLQKRYFKLVIPYFAAVLLSIAGAFVARQLMVDEAIPAPPTLRQILAHVVLLQSVLGIDSLSAGVWYVAIDFQLFSLMLALLWLARGIGGDRGRRELAGVALIASLAAASLFFFNRDADWDNWGLYFFGAYALGALTYLASAAGRSGTRWLLAMAIVVALALLVDFRSRIAVALLTALALGLAQHFAFLENRPRLQVLAYLGKISYSVFLVHFPVVLVTNAVYAHAAAASPLLSLVGVALGWAASVAVGALFYRYVESRAGSWLATVKLALSPKA